MNEIQAIKKLQYSKKKECEELQKIQDYSSFTMDFVENSSQPIGIGSLNGDIWSVNQAFCDLLGYTKEEFKNLKWTKGITPPEWQGAEIEYIQRLLQTGKPQRYEKEYLRKDGSKVPVEIVGYLQKDSQQNVAYYSVFVSDITERKNKEISERIYKQDLEKVVAERTTELQKINKELKDKNFELMQEIAKHKEAEERFFLAFHSSPDMMAISEIASAVFIDVNENFAQTFGFKKEEVIGKSLNDLNIVGRDVRNKVIQTIQSQGYVNNLEVNVRNKQGEEVVLLHSMKFIELQKKKYFLTASKDITELKRVEKELHNANETLRMEVEERKKIASELNKSNTFVTNIVKSISDGFYVLDENWNVTYINEEALRIAQVSKEEILNKNFWLVLSRFVNTIFFERFHYAVKKKEPVKFEFSGVNFPGAYFIIHAYPYDNGLTVYFNDITEQKKAENNLRLSEERFFKAFNSNLVIMAISTFEEGRFLEVNDCFLEKSGYRREEVIGRTLTELNFLIKPERKYIIKELSEKDKVINLEVMLKSKNGEMKIGQYYAELIEMNGQKCILVMIVDITQSRQYEKEIVRLDKLNLIGQMSAGISHEIRNPMTTVRGFLQILYEKEKYSDEKEFFDLMISELDRANAIITEYLLLAQNKDINLQFLNLNSLIDKLSPLIFADALRQDKTVIIDSENIPKLPLDESEMRQLILNLARNGLEAMNPQTQLTIKTYIHNKEVVLEVRDEGTGISPEILEKLGTPFFTTKDTGTGLGLAICYSIAHRHHAKIEVKSNSKGTSFFVRFNTTHLLNVKKIVMNN